jgi:hypothetical protein
MDLTTNHLAGLDVGTHLGQPSNPVKVSTAKGSLEDGHRHMH